MQPGHSEYYSLLMTHRLLLVCRDNILTIVRTCITIYYTVYYSIFNIYLDRNNSEKKTILNKIKKKNY